MAAIDNDTFRSQDSTEKCGAAHVDYAGSPNLDLLDHNIEFSVAELGGSCTVSTAASTTSCIMHYVSLKDRTSLSAAATDGMAVELELTVGFRYI